NNQEAFFVGHLIHLIGIGVMAGAEAVRADPLHALIVTLDCDKVQPAAAQVGVLMLAKAAQIDRLAVKQELAVRALKGTHAGLLIILIHNGGTIHNPHNKVVQVGSVHIPQMGVCNVEGAGLAGALGNLVALGVVDLNHTVVVAVGHNSVIHIGVGAIQVVNNREIGDLFFRQAKQLDRALQAGVVVEVEIR